MELKKPNVGRFPVLLGAAGAIVGVVGAGYVRSMIPTRLMPKRYRKPITGAVLIGGAAAAGIAGASVGKASEDIVKEIPFIGHMLTGKQSTVSKIGGNLVQGTVSGVQHIGNVLIPPPTHTTWKASMDFPEPWNLGQPKDLAMARKWAMGRYLYGEKMGWYKSASLKRRIPVMSYQQIKDIQWR